MRAKVPPRLLDFGSRRHQSATQVLTPEHVRDLVASRINSSSGIPSFATLNSARIPTNKHRVSAYQVTYRTRSRGQWGLTYSSICCYRACGRTHPGELVPYGVPPPICRCMSYMADSKPQFHAIDSVDAYNLSLCASHTSVSRTTTMRVNL